MAESIWLVRRYNLPRYDKHRLASDINSWVKKRKGKVRVQHAGDVLDPLRRTIKTFYGIWVPERFIKDLLSGGNTTNMIVCHESFVLYVYTRALPEGFEDINEAVFENYVARNGGTPFNEAAHVLDMNERSFVEKYILERDVHSTFKKLLAEGALSPAMQLPSTQHILSTSSPSVQIHLEGEPERAHILSEEVSVPPGVTIKVKRSRMIEHSVDVNWRASGGGSIDAGFKPLLSASIRGEIEREQGRTYQESETVEYEVALNGEKSTRYQLKWTDVWRKGVAEYREGNQTYLVPFRFREWAELQVLPIGS